jgi:hypothetical protein
LSDFKRGALGAVAAGSKSHGFSASEYKWHKTSVRSALKRFLAGGIIPE